MKISCAYRRVVNFLWAFPFLISEWTLIYWPWENKNKEKRRKKITWKNFFILFFLFVLFATLFSHVVTLILTWTVESKPQTLKSANCFSLVVATRKKKQKSKIECETWKLNSTICPYYYFFFFIISFALFSFSQSSLFYHRYELSLDCLSFNVQKISLRHIHFCCCFFFLFTFSSMPSNRRFFFAVVLLWMKYLLSCVHLVT